MSASEETPRRAWQRRVVQPDDVLAQRLPDDEVIFLHLGQEEYHGLDAVAGQMWHALVTSASVEEAYGTLLATFDVDADVLARDLDALLDRLERRGLVAFD